MNKKMRKYLIFSSSIVLVLGIVGFMMFGLWDFYDPEGTNDRGLRLDDTDDNSRGDYTFIGGSDVTFKDIGEAVGYLLWEARGVDIIIVGIILLVASEAASSVVKGIEDQCAEFRTELCETDKFVILERKDAEELEEAG